ncbi:hypothetical protein Tco_0288033, partial [Tanacetum coccineum]
RHVDFEEGDFVWAVLTKDRFPVGEYNDGGPSIKEQVDLFLEAQDRVKKRASVK